MKKLFVLFLLSSPCVAGTITTNYSPLGTITISSGTAAATNIAFDAQSNSGFVSGGSPLTWNHTLGGSANFIAVGCATRISDEVSGVTVGGAAMTKSTDTFSGTAERTFIFTKASPATGTQSIAAATTSGISDRVKCGAVSWSGVSGVDVSTGTRNSGGGVQVNTLVTTVANAVLFDVVSDGNTSESITAQSGQSQFWSEGTGWTTLGSTRAVTTAASYNLEWQVVNTPSCQSSIAVKP